MPAEPPLSFDDLARDLEPRRRRLLDHAVYAAIDSLPRLRAFMETHVFAVWDFMSLVKRLQRDFTCVDLPWRPPRAPSLARFVNEVVLEEESDLGPSGPCSHLELYLGAMREVDASTKVFEEFLGRVTTSLSPADALDHPAIAPSIRSFVGETMRCASRASTVEVMAVFLFGRESLLPAIYERLLPRCEVGGQTAALLRFYLERHIEVDGGSHAPIARRALTELAGDDAAAWAAARDAAHRALDARHGLWDGALERVLAASKSE